MLRPMEQNSETSIYLKYRTHVWLLGPLFDYIVPNIC